MHCRNRYDENSLLMCVVVGLVVTSSAAAQSGQAVDLVAQPFDLAQVRLLDGPFKAAQERDRKYLRDLDADRLLHPFRLNAGLTSAAQPLRGWERPDCELRGHTMGHYLSACALMYAATGDDTLTRIDLRIRIPYWAVNGLFVRLNGQTLASEPTAAGYVRVNRQCQDNDRLELRMPMSLHRHLMPDDATLMAFMYGPFGR